MKGKKVIIAMVLTILIFVPISSQCDRPKSPNDERLFDKDAGLDVATSNLDEPDSSAEFNPDSLHVAALLLCGGLVGLLALRRSFKKKYKGHSNGFKH